MDVTKLTTSLLQVVSWEDQGLPSWLKLLELSMDMEADLGIVIPSKRVEIFGCTYQAGILKCRASTPMNITELRTLAEIRLFIVGENVKKKVIGIRRYWKLKLKSPIMEKTAKKADSGPNRCGFPRSETFWSWIENTCPPDFLGIYYAASHVV